MRSCRSTPRSSRRSVRAPPAGAPPRRVVHENMQEYFRHVYDHLVRTVDKVNQFERHEPVPAPGRQPDAGRVRQNQDMRKIAAWAAILAVPTALAGVYGMNFDHMPEELGWNLGYPAALATMALAYSSCTAVPGLDPDRSEAAVAKTGPLLQHDLARPSISTSKAKLSTVRITTRIPRTTTPSTVWLYDDGRGRGRYRRSRRIPGARSRTPPSARASINDRRFEHADPPRQSGRCSR